MEAMEGMKEGFLKLNKILKSDIRIFWKMI